MANALPAVQTSAAVVLAHQLARALPSRSWRTRFAPAPTGFLHLGHVVNAMHVWGIARAYGGAVVLRIEDHDRTRARAEFERALWQDLEWLGFTADANPARRNLPEPFRQSDNLNRYASLLTEWEGQQLVYPCVCTRRDIVRNAAPATGSELRYPGTCATACEAPASTSARRARLSARLERFIDIRLGAQHQQPAAQCGDVLVRDRNGNFTYQFAVVVDDFDQHIDVVIRGEDLLPSTGRQMQLSRLLGRTVPPLVLHHALLLRADGLKLSKSLGDTGVRELRGAGLSAADVLGRAAHLSGLIEEPVPLNQEELSRLFTA
jgi:glutamyl-tRNA synthetase/glutamyl-Q tRNA(Asp) synthetase